MQIDCTNNSYLCTVNKMMRKEINQFSLCGVKTIIHPIILYYYEEIINRTTD